jgi:hypothetical protein
LTEPHPIRGLGELLWEVLPEGLRRASFASDGNSQMGLGGAPADRALRIVEGRDALDPIEWKRFEIGKTKIAHPVRNYGHSFLD